MIDFQGTSQFRINVKDRKKHFFSFDELTVKSFYKVVSRLGRTIKLEDLKKWELTLLDVNENPRKNFRLLRCLVFECKTEAGREYHFSHGRWYRINQEFSQHLEEIDVFRRDKINGHSLPAYRHENENEYNRELSAELDGHCLDSQLIPMHGYDKIELCDVLLIEGATDVNAARKNVFVHVKRKHGGSSGLSHLFQQGSVSLTLLNSEDQNFLKGIKNLRDDFDESLSAVVHYLIVGDKPDDSIPLFARISLYKTIREIHSKRGEIYWSVVDPKPDPA